MKQAVWKATGGVLLALLMAGCGGSGGSGGLTNRSVVQGRVSMPASGSMPALTARVANTIVTAPVQADGSFVLNGVPFGPQTIQIVDGSNTVVETTGVDVKDSTTVLEPLPAPTTSTPGSSGISGTVFEGPIAPASHPGDPNEAPFAGATLQIAPAGGGAAAQTVTSGADGTFSISLPPGQYQIVPQSPNGSTLPHADPVLVTVTADHTTVVQINYDTGIR